MPNAASKRAEARKVARVQQAHETRPAVATPPVNRRVPLVQGRNVRRGPGALVRDYPWGTAIFVLLIIGLILLVLYNQHLGPWTQKPTPKQAVCNLTTHTCNKAPLMTINTSHYYTATLKTKYGDMVIQLDAANAPIAVNNFVFLARAGFYNGLTFDRIEHPGQISTYTNQPSNLDIIQGGAGGSGDARDGGPGYKLKFDNNAGNYSPGTVAVANESQFFICLSDMSQVITGTTFDIFGHVTVGLDVANKVQLNDVMQSITIAETTVQPTPGPTYNPTTAATTTP
jgi:peptidyl-prolyl cis-trans isomerase B (cyclophilin B)